MYSVFEMLCEKNGVTPYKVGKETKMATSTLSDWKNGKSTPKQDKLKLIADYFSVSVDYLKISAEELSTGEKPEIPNFEPEHLELIELYSKLKEEQKSAVINLLRSFAL